MTETAEFDLSSVDALDESDYTIKDPRTDQPTTWVWTFYGPAHPKTVELSNRVSKEVLHEQTQHKQAQLNGKKIKLDQPSLDEIRVNNVEGILARTKTFTPVRINGELIEFSPENARKLLLDRRKGWLFTQVLEYVRVEENFIPPSATS